MKPLHKFLFASVALVGLQFGGLAGCVGGAAVETDGGVYYGGDPWFHDDVWVHGGRGFYGHDHGYVHPVGRPSGHVSVGAHGGNDHHR
jgi:hypothetical protein